LMWTTIITNVTETPDPLWNICTVYIDGFIGFMVFNATFNNISVISWRSVSLVEETGVPGENRRPAASHRQTVVSWTPRHERDSNSQLMWREAPIAHIVVNPTTVTTTTTPYII